MDSIRQQIRLAQRRLLVQQFLSLFGWVMAATLAFGAVGYATAKVWVLSVDSEAWFWTWIGGALLTGLTTALLAAYCTRRSSLEAAMEIDRRFRLEERLSSTLALDSSQIETPVGQALLADTQRQAKRIDVRDGFVIRAPWTIGLPLVPAIIIFGLALLVPDAAERAAQQAQASPEAPEVVRKETERLSERLREKRASLSQEELAELDELLKQLEVAAEELRNKEGLNQKRALMEVNEMTRLVSEKREQVSGAEEMRKQFSKLKNIQQGPGDKLAQAMRQGNLSAAREQIEKLQKQLESESLTEDEQEALQKQLEEMKEKLQESVRAFEEAKRDLEKQIEQKMRSGDQEGANQLQQKLNRLQRMDRQMSQLEQMAQQLGACSECLQQGDSSEAAAQLGQLSQDLGDLQKQLDRLQTLDEMLGQLADCKSGLCDGDGMPMDSGMMANLDNGSFFSEQSGDGMGPGQGYGERPEEATETGLYDSQVAGQLQRGQTVVTGVADGPNVAGQTQVDVREAIQSALRERADPLTDEQIPRDQRDHAKEYFQRFRPE